ncbi:hypothetical protein ACFDTO_18475 [Microbacteriaceae bacterium 4G12]
MLQHSLGKEDVLRIAEMLIEQLDPESENDRFRMTQGLQLYRQGRVYNVSFEGYTLEGTVEDEGSIHSASLSTSNMEHNSCDCIGTGCCEHIIAILLYSASSFGQVGEIMKRFKNKGKTEDILPKIKTAKQLLTASSYDEMDQTTWLAYFDKEYASFQKDQKRYSYRQMYFLMNIFEEFYMKLTRKAPRLTIVRELFELNAALFCFMKLIEEEKRFKEEHIYSYYQPQTVALRFIDEVEILADKLTAATFPMAFDELLGHTTRLVHEVLFSSSLQLQARYYIYRHLWINLLNQPIWLQEESERVAQQTSSLLQPLATAHLLFLQKKDNEMMELLDAQELAVISFYPYWIRELCSLLEWERVQKWLSFSYKKLKQYINIEVDDFLKRDTVRFFLASYELYANQTNEQAGYEMVLQELLPYSLAEYDNYLLDKQQYHTWTELQLFVGFQTLDKLKDELKEIEKVDRAALLPLYHHAIIETIGMKNRPSYRLAVRYLKKLRTHYKKLKRNEEWDAYIATLSASFSRLRALQEELRKGKLIDENTN